MLATSSPLGGDASYLIRLFFATGVLALLFASAIAVKERIAPRRMGDPDSLINALVERAVRA